MIQVEFQEIKKILSEKNGWKQERSFSNIIFTHKLKNKLTLCAQTCFGDEEVVYTFNDLESQTQDKVDKFLNIYGIYRDDYGSAIGVKKSKQIFANEDWKIELKKVIVDMFDDMKYAHLNNDFVKLVMACDDPDNQELIEDKRGFIYSVLKGTEIKHGGATRKYRDNEEYFNHRFNKMHGKYQNFFKNELIREGNYKNGDYHGLWKEHGHEMYYLFGNPTSREVYLKEQYTELLKALE